jgi:hypothetical protein
MLIILFEPGRIIPQTYSENSPVNSPWRSSLKRGTGMLSFFLLQQYILRYVNFVVIFYVFVNSGNKYCWLDFRGAVGVQGRATRIADGNSVPTEKMSSHSVLNAFYGNNH